MASLKEIRVKIASVKSTQKITKAMELVAASKMRKAQQNMAASRPYARKIRNVVGHLANASAEYKHPYFKERDAKRVGFIVVSTDRGLCGGLNINLFKRALQESKTWRDQGVEVDFCLLGLKAQSFFRSVGGKVVATAAHLGEKPAINDLIGTVQAMLQAYEKGEIDRLFLVSNEFVNTMTQKPEVHQLLPLLRDESQQYKHHWDYIYEPEAKELMNLVMTRFIESQVYQSVVENNACEQAARMVAMKAATDNAGSLIRELQLVYNKARQAAITQEIAEIVGGAAAV
ncbi:MAG: F0F1 ATP synthase subunit gamma [Pseudomonadota bacterium]